ncbi:MAG: DUF5615 family PIN-like protein [Hyphomicrobiales bacterium]|nr:DUF5615 family PIN-like protein [Hyphomicrobiales bacterium]
MLLFDLNLSPRLAKKLKSAFPGCNHAARLELSNADLQIQRYAAQFGIMVVTKDADFLEIARRHKSYKTIYVRLPNCKIDEVAGLLLHHADEIRRFHASAGNVLVLPPP